LNTGDLIRALQELRRTVELEPHNLKAQVSLGNLLLAAGEYQDARERAELVLKEDAKNLDAQILLGDSYAGLKDVQASLREIRQATELSPDKPRPFFNLAILQSGGQQNTQAEESFKKALQLDPKYLPAVLSLGNFYMRQKRWSESEQQFRRAIELQPKQPLSRVALAALYLAQDQKAQAVQSLVEAKKALHDDSEGYRLLGDFYLLIGDLNKAVTEYHSLYREHPKDPVVRKNYIHLLTRAGRLDEAEKLNAEVLHQNPKDPGALIQRGEILSRQRRWTDAIQAFQSALKTGADGALAHYNLGLAFAGVGDTSQAETEWREAVRLRPGMVQAQRALADAALAKGDLAQLRQSGEAVVRLAPTFQEGYIYRGMARVSQSDEAGGEADLQRAIELAPQSPLGYTQLAAWRLGKKRYADAEKLFDKALELDPNYFDAMAGLLDLYMAAKQPAKAQARLKEQIAKAPTNSSFYLLQAKLELTQKDLEKAEAASQKAVDLEKNNLQATLLRG